MALNWCGFNKYLATVEKFEANKTPAQILDHYRVKTTCVQLHCYWLDRIEAAAKNASKTEAEYNTLMLNAREVVLQAQALFDKMHPVA